MEWVRPSYQWNSLRNNWWCSSWRTSTCRQEHSLTFLMLLTPRHTRNQSSSLANMNKSSRLPTSSSNSPNHLSSKPSTNYTSCNKYSNNTIRHKTISYISRPSNKLVTYKHYRTYPSNEFTYLYIHFYLIPISYFIIPIILSLYIYYIKLDINIF